MKKIIILLSLFLCSINISYTVEASNQGETTPIKVKVTEYIPGSNCKCITGGNTSSEIGPCGGDEKNHLYECEVQKGFGTVVSMLGNIIKYFTFLAGLGGVLFIVINGIMYSMGGMDQGMKDEAKKRIVATLVGLILLFLSGVILNLVAPWIYV